MVRPNVLSHHAKRLCRSRVRGVVGEFDGRPVALSAEQIDHLTLGDGDRFGVGHKRHKGLTDARDDVATKQANIKRALRCVPIDFADSICRGSGRVELHEIRRANAARHPGHRSDVVVSSKNRST